MKIRQIGDIWWPRFLNLPGSASDAVCEMLTWLHPLDMGACRAEVEGIIAIINYSSFQCLLLRKNLTMSTADDWFFSNSLMRTNRIIVIVEASSV